MLEASVQAGLTPIIRSLINAITSVATACAKWICGAGVFVWINLPTSLVLAPLVSRCSVLWRHVTGATTRIDDETAAACALDATRPLSAHFVDFMLRCAMLPDRFAVNNLLEGFNIIQVILVD